MGPVGSSPRRLRAQSCCQKSTAETRHSQEHIRSRAELFSPVGRGIHLLLELLQVRAEPFSRTVDVCLYFVGCFIHSRFSFSVSMVRSGIG